MKWLRKLWNLLTRRKRTVYGLHCSELRMGLQPIHPRKVIPILYKREAKTK
jgi:hypothetical protein